MRILLDTNVLTCLIQPEHPQHARTLDALEVLRQRGDDFCLVPQNIYEFWVVCSRPREQNGMGLSAQQINDELTKIGNLFRLYRDERAIFQRWESLVAVYDVRGKNAHDARLVAAMLRHGWSCLFTLNAADFHRYTKIQVITPESIHEVTASE